MTAITTQTVVSVTRTHRARAIPVERTALPAVRDVWAVLPTSTVVATNDRPRPIGKVRAAVDNTGYQGVGADA